MNYFSRQELPLPIILLRISIGVIYLWFGLLKFFPHLSPAEDLAKETIRILTFGLISPDLYIILLPHLSFTHLPYALTLVGQYIIKNIVIVSALLVIKSHLKNC